MKTRKRLLSLLVCACMVLALLPVTAWALDDVAYIDKDGQTQTKDGVTELTAETTAWADGTWYVATGNVTIPSRVVVTGDVHLILADGCQLTAEKGIQVETGHALTIYAQSAGAGMGRLTAKGGDDAAIGGNAGSAGSAGGSCGTVTICGGAVTATAGDGAGIGGGQGDATVAVSTAVNGGNGGTVTIYGGAVTASGGDGAGIGGGAGSGHAAGGDGGTVAIYGGTVTAGSNRGAGIGGGRNGADMVSETGRGYGGTLTLNGNCWVNASLVGPSDDGLTTTRGVLFTGESSTGTMYGSVTLSADAEVPAGKTLTIGNEQTLTVPDGVTLTNNGTITNGDTLTVGGTLDGAGTVTSAGTLTVGGLTVKASGTGSVDYIGDTANANAGFRLTKNGDYAISGTWTGGNLGSTGDSQKAVVTVTNGLADVNVTLDGAVIALVGNTYTSAYICAFNMTGATVNMTVSDINTLISTNNRAGLEAPDGSKLTIEGTGTLTAEGDYGAGIGGTGGYAGGTPTAGGEITIQGNVTVEATSHQGAGIGGGSVGAGGNGGVVLIKDSAKVTASSTYGAGIGGGGGSSGNGSGGTITIEGNAQVEAISRDSAGIGAGYSGGPTSSWGSAGSITISGGAVTATSTEYYGIGGNGGTVNIVPAGGRQIAVKVGADAATATALDESPFTADTDISDLVINKGKYFHSVQEVPEQFTLTPGGTYWFDLSGAGIPGTKNEGYDGGGGPDYAYPGLPDSSLHWVPFTYTGTINAYSRTSAGISTDSDVTPYDHSLFIADYNVTHDVSWNELNGAGFIFGSSTGNYASGNVAYSLRAPSVGSYFSGSNANLHGTPLNNEWDAVLNKAGQDWEDNTGGYIKNWRNIHSLGQDSRADDAWWRALRGFISACHYYSHHASEPALYIGYRPVLEVLNANTLGKEGLKAVTVDLNGGKLDTTTGYAGAEVTEMNIVYTGDTFTAPSADYFTRPDGDTGSYFKWQGSDGNTYDPGAAVPAGVGTLTAQWTAPAPSGGGTSYYTLTFDTGGGSEIEPLRRAGGTTVALAGYVPERAGFTFAGWYADEELTERVTEIHLTRDATVYAGWHPFRDVDEGDWFNDEVLYVYRRGLMVGTDTDTFSPDSSTTRAMLATILWRMEGGADPEGANPFSDVAAGLWYSKAVVWCYEQGLASGYGGGLFGPNDPITREQLAAMLYRYAQYKGWDVSAGEDTNILSYTDFDQIGEWAIPAMQWACGAGIVNGRTADTLDPQGEATRAEIAVMLMRMLETYDPDFALPAGEA